MSPLAYRINSFTLEFKYAAKGYCRKIWSSVNSFILEFKSHHIMFTCCNTESINSFILEFKSLFLSCLTISAILY